MKATEKQLNYITRLMGNTYMAEYSKLTIKTASALIDAIKQYKNPLLIGFNDGAELGRVYEQLCVAETRAFGHIFATR